MSWLVSVYRVRPFHIHIETSVMEGTLVVAAGNGVRVSFLAGLKAKGVDPTTASTVMLARGIPLEKVGESTEIDLELPSRFNSLTLDVADAHGKPAQ